MNLATPESVRKLQRALYAKAKANPALRFYSLYDKIYRRDVLAFAWQRCRFNGGCAGVDGQTFEQIESAGLRAWLDQLTEELKGKTYRPQAVRRGRGRNTAACSERKTCADFVFLFRRAA